MFRRIGNRTIKTLTWGWQIFRSATVRHWHVDIQWGSLWKNIFWLEGEVVSWRLFVKTCTFSGGVGDLHARLSSQAVKTFHSAVDQLEQTPQGCSREQTQHLWHVAWRSNSKVEGGPWQDFPFSVRFLPFFSQLWHCNEGVRKLDSLPIIVCKATLFSWGPPLSSTDFVKHPQVHL